MFFICIKGEEYIFTPVFMKDVSSHFSDTWKIPLCVIPPCSCYAASYVDNFWRGTAPSACPCQSWTGN